MEIANIKGFAEAYNDLRTYFNRIEPYEVRQISMFPVVTGPYTSRIKKSFKADAWDIPCNSETFEKLYDGFIEELSNAVLEYSQQTVQVMLESYFSNSTDAFSNDDVFVNSLGDIFKNDREDLIELIELFYKTRKQINNLITDSGAGYYGLIGYYDSFREEAMKKRLQKSNETKKASTNESVHKFSEDEAMNTVQSSSGLATYFYNDERIMQAFLTHVNGKVGKPIAVEIKALSVLGKIDTSNLSALLRSVGIDSNKKDGVIRYFRDSHQNKLLSTDEAVASAIKHYSLL